MNTFGFIVIYYNFVIFQVVDLTDDMSSGDVEIIDGGIFERFIELHFKSRIGGGLEYDIQVYTE